MTQINISISGLEEQISLLNSLNSSFGSQKTDMPEISGTGPVASRTSETGQTLLLIRESLKELFAGTIDFLNAAQSCYVNTDTQIADEYGE